jgi:multidrug resistance efflux pump
MSGPHPDQVATDPEAIETLASVIELVSRINREKTLSGAAEQAVSSIGRWFGSAQIGIAWQPRPGHPCRWIAQPMSAPGNEKTFSALGLAAAEEILTRGRITDSAAASHREQAALLAVKQYAHALNAKRVFGVSLGTAFQTASSARTSADYSGAIVISLDRMISENEAERFRQRLDVLAEPFMTALVAAAERELSPLGRVQKAWRQRSAGRKLSYAAIGLMIGCAVLSIPMPYHAEVDCELQPIVRRFVAVPVDAPLQSVHVRPGDEVEKGQLLAEMDPREIEMELAGKQAELRRSQQEQKGLLAQHKTAESQLTGLQVERLQAEADRLRFRRGQLKLRSPVSGIVVTGDWTRSEGTPLERGETLFEIAPLGTFRIEIAVDEADVLLVRPGMELLFRLDAMPSQLVRAKVECVHPRAEIKDNNNVFIADATVVDSDGWLRPGMRGYGYIKTDRHPIAWNLFHKAYDRLITMVGG